jgi:ABC-type glycerol-3-phosphate transport system permease component
VEQSLSNQYYTILFDLYTTFVSPTQPVRAAQNALGSLPLLLLFALGMRPFIQGLAAGAIKA